jgi:hypothetical protein
MRKGRRSPTKGKEGREAMKRPKKYSDMDGLQKLDYILLIVQLAAFALGVFGVVGGLLSGEITIPQWLIDP